MEQRQRKFAVAGAINPKEVNAAVEKMTMNKIAVGPSRVVTDRFKIINSMFNLTIKSLKWMAYLCNKIILV